MLNKLEILQRVISNCLIFNFVYRFRSRSTPVDFNIRVTCELSWITHDLWSVTQMGLFYFFSVLFALPRSRHVLNFDSIFLIFRLFASPRNTKEMNHSAHSFQTEEGYKITFQFAHWKCINNDIKSRWGINFSMMLNNAICDILRYKRDWEFNFKNSPRDYLLLHSQKAHFQFHSQLTYLQL